MVDIHVSRDGNALGIFSETDVRAGLSEGRFQPTDFAWQSGMQDWMPLSQWPQFAAGKTPPPTPEGIGASAVVADGPAWEHRATLGFFPAVIQTFKGVLLAPGETFANMRQTGGLGSPLFFNLLMSWIGLTVAAGLQFLLQGTVMATSMAQRAETADFAEFFTGGMLFVVFAILVALIPIFVAIGLLIGSLLLHLCLMIVGGANQPFESTFRVVAYAGGCGNGLAVIPFCGQFGGIWALVVMVIGLMKVHNIGAGRAILAVFLPIIAICLCGIIIAVLAAAGGAAH